MRRIFIKSKIYLRKIRRSFTKRSIINDIQSQAIVDIKMMIRKAESTLLVDPLGGKWIIEYNNYFVIITGSAVSITNGKFSYYIYLPSDRIEEIIKMFNKHVNVRRDLLVDKYNNKTYHNLKEIYKTLKNED